MSKTIASINTKLLVGALVLTLCACSESGATGGNGSSASLANDPAASVTVAAGSEFVSDSVGVQLRMPAGITGSFDATGGTLFFGNPQNTLGGFIFGGSAGGVQAGASRAIRTLLPLLELEIAQVFDDSVNPDGSTSAQFGAVNAAGNQVFMHLNVHMGTSGNYIAILGNSMFNDQSELSSLITQMSGSVVFSAPAPATGLTNITGIVLEANSSNTNFNGSGSTTGGDESFLVTCTDGRYRFASTSSFFISFDGGAGASNTESVEHEGMLATQVDFAGNQLLSLHSFDQGTFVFNVTPNNGSIFLDQTPFQQTGTSEQQCS
ncbi:MAG: hypothetical protein AB8B79_15660 [Granulosicoccus sp.]